ncbi:uncharacterized protein [Physcomitrium patens]|uniref:uncharacterized protein n=1 Tax=Physcomitrium patens TaxID=3218 RepID=UPI003CCD8B88
MVGRAGRGGVQKGCCGGSGGGGAGVEQQYGEGAWTGKGRRWCGSEGVVHKVVARWGGGVGGCRPSFKRWAQAVGFKRLVPMVGCASACSSRWSVGGIFRYEPPQML